MADISSALSNGFNMIASAYNAAAGAEMDKYTRKMNREFFEKANQYNHDEAILAFNRSRDEWTRQFNLQNEYNSPSAQMARYAAAGINPYMALNNFQNAASVSGVGSSSASSTSAPYNSPYSTFGSNFLSSLNQSSDAALKILDMTTNSANLPLKINTSKSILESEGVKAVYDKTYNTLKLAKVDDIVAQELAQLEAHTNYLFNSVDLSRANVEQQRSITRFLNKTFNDRVDDIIKSNHLKDWQAENIRQSLEMARVLNHAEIRSIDANIKHLDFQNKLLLTQSALNTQQYAFAAEMNPFLIHNQAMGNALQRQQYRFNADSNPYRINALIWNNRLLENQYNNTSAPDTYTRMYNQAVHGKWYDPNTIGANIWLGTHDALQLGFPSGSRRHKR